MKRKMYILRTWDYKHRPKLSSYVADDFDKNLNAPYITSSILSAKKFYTKKDAIKCGKKFGGCYIDCVWSFKKECYNGQILDLWK